jgi:potassium efflux system protein
MLRALCITLLLSTAAISTITAQKRDTIVLSDTVARISFVDKVREIGKKAETNSLSRFETDIITGKQNELIESIKKKTLQAKEYLKGGIDTIDIHNEFRKIESKLVIAGDGVFTNKSPAQTFRNLSTTYNILHELLNRANAQKDRLDKYQKKLDNFMYEIDSLSSNPILFKLPPDSAIVITYLQKVVNLTNETAPVDSMLKKAIADVHGLQKQVNADVNQLAANLEEIERYEQHLSARISEREFSNLGGAIHHKRPVSEIVKISLTKAQIILWFYAKNNWGKILLTLMIIGTLTFFLKSIKKSFKIAGQLHPEYEGQLVLRYPFLSSLIAVLNLAQFFFPAPPFIFSSLFWIISAIALNVICISVTTKFWLSVWRIMLALFLCACINNLFLQVTNLERAGMALLALAGCISGTIIILKGINRVPREKLIFYFIGWMVFLEISSLIANIFGRHNLANSLFSSGYFNVIIGYLFLWTMRLLDEMFVLTYKIYIGQERKLFSINFERLGQRVPLFLYVLLFIGWFILFGRNFYEFRLIADPFLSFLYSDRTIGDFTYSISGILIFFLIIACSLMLSKIVSFFASDKILEKYTVSQDRKANAGSWLLLVRVAILIIGFLLAFAATGLPMERITLVLGALGVGIGFGMQTLVNNLVSGLIIAFEKPVNVGDIVEINGRSGMVKSIGFRSCIISRFEGADVVIPNGDILNAQLINWTLGGSIMRVDLFVKIAHGPDLISVKKLLTDMLTDFEHVLALPQPTVYLYEFSNNVVNVKISFWVHDFRDSTAIKSEVIQAMDLLFKEHNIIIPLPQQELRISNNDADEKKG